MDQNLAIDFLLVGIFGALVGTTELLSRYRDAPLRVIFSWFAIGYIVVNVLAAMGALWLVRLFGIDFGLDPLTQAMKLRWVQVMAAGFASMMLFRSSIFVLRVGDQDVSVGPSSVLDVLLTVLDREIDRKRAQERAKEVDQVMDGISFRKASDQLPVVAFALMQNLPREEQDQIINKVLQLTQNTKLSEAARSKALGLALMDFVGKRVLEEAVELVREDIISVPPQTEGAGQDKSLANALSAALQTRAAEGGAGTQQPMGGVGNPQAITDPVAPPGEDDTVEEPGDQ
jgi:hypothetical protein